MWSEDEKELNYYFIGNNPLIGEGLQTSTIEEAYSYLKDKEVISLDIETTRKFGGKFAGEGLQPHLSKIVMVQMGDENKQFIIDYRTEDLGKLKYLLINPEICIVGQNIKFEYLHFLHNEGIRINRLYDTMIAEQILFNGLKIEASLKALNEKYLGITVDKSTALEFLSVGSKPFTLRQIKYGAEDILYPLLIRQLQFPQLDSKGVRDCMNLEMLFIECLGDIEYKGMHFNQDRWEATYEKNKVQYLGYLKELGDYVLKHYSDTVFVDKQLSLFDEEFKCRISWTSSKQVVAFLRYLHACPMEKSKTTNKLAYTVNAKVLKSSLNTINKFKSKEVIDFINLYIRFKETEQSCTTFGTAFFKYVNPVTNRLHSNYRQILNTGRISSSGPNLQNIPSAVDDDYGKEDPRHDMFRYAFDCPVGWKIVNADYSGQETVILANVAEEKNMLELIRNGGDMHAFVTKALDPSLAHLTDKEIKKEHAEERQIAKSAGFAIQFGGNGHTISKNLGVDIEVGEAAYNAYFKAFPDLYDYFDAVAAKAMKDGYVLIDPVTGRKRYFIPPTNNKEKHTIYKMALNAPIQGTAGSMTKLAAVRMRKWILDNNLQHVVFITNIVHDEINLEVIEEYAELAARALEIAMNTAAEKWCKIVPLTAGAVVTEYWTH